MGIGCKKDYITLLLFKSTTLLYTDVTISCTKISEQSSQLLVSISWILQDIWITSNQFFSIPIYDMLYVLFTMKFLVKSQPLLDLTKILTITNYQNNNIARSTCTFRWPDNTHSLTSSSTTTTQLPCPWAKCHGKIGVSISRPRVS